MCATPKGVVFELFSAENRHRAAFAHFGLESASVFEGTTGGNECIRRFIPNE